MVNFLSLTLTLSRLPKINSATYASLRDVAKSWETADLSEELKQADDKKIHAKPVWYQAALDEYMSRF